MNNSYDLIAVSVITVGVTIGGLIVATQPSKPNKRDEREKAILAELEKISEWKQLSAAPLHEQEFHQLDTVALLKAIPEEYLMRGKVGTVLEVLAPEVLLIEFSRAKDGSEIVTKTISTSHLLKILHEPNEEFCPSRQTCEHCASSAG